MQILALAKEIKNFTSFILDGKLFDYIDEYLVCLSFSTNINIIIYVISIQNIFLLLFSYMFCILIILFLPAHDSG